MRFDSIEINNYRQYHSLLMEFPKKGKTDLHVVVASNGVGKTNLLNAINWCLYGDEPHLGNSKDSLTICSHIGLEEAKKQGNKKATVSVIIKASTEENKYVFDRKIEVNTDNYFPSGEKFKVTVTGKDGDTEIFEDNLAVEIVNQYLPEKIREYFFFDGERLHNYFNAQGTTHVKDSIYQIAQINVISNARTHLKKIIDEYQGVIGKSNPEVDKLKEEQKELEKEKDKLIYEIDELEKSIVESDKTIEELTQKIAGTETLIDDDRRYKNNTETIAEKEASIEKIDESIKSFIRKYYKLLVFYKFNAATNEYIQGKYHKGALPPKIDTEMLKNSLKKHRCVLCDCEMNDKTEEKMIELLNKIEVSSDVSHKLTEIKNDVKELCEETKNYKEEKNKLFSLRRKLEDEIKVLSEENEELYKRLGTCSSVEQIKLWNDQRAINKELVKTNSEKKGVYKEKVDELDKKIASKEKEIEKATTDCIKCEEIKKQLFFTKNAYNVVSSIEKEIIDEVRNNMEKTTMSFFEKLIWKKNTYGRIELNDDYSLKLYHKITNESCLGSCSAAERELLALAFTIALHNVSGHDCLLFIDTPVGRVSDLNRENFAESLISVSKNKQLILAFTPSEFSDEIKKYFDGSVLASKIVMLSQDEEETYKEVK